VKEGVIGTRAYDGRWWEWQANRAIGGLLLPRELVKKAVIRFLDQSAVTGLPTLAITARESAVAQVVAIFDVNPAATRIKLGEIYPDAGGQMGF
jgi:hypothetical protein